MNETPKYVRLTCAGRRHCVIPGCKHEPVVSETLMAEAESWAAWIERGMRGGDYDEAAEFVRALIRELEQARERETQAVEALRACLEDAEGQEAVQRRKLLTLTRGQVQLLAAALARLREGSPEGDA